MLRATRQALRLPIGKERPKSAAPLITRTRTWRGNMQVRYDTGETDNKKFFIYGFLGAPFRVFSVFGLAFGFCYVVLGHDEFMFQLMGYESEMQYEAIVNPQPEDTSLNARYTSKGSLSPLRSLERPLHPAPVFEDHLVSPRSSTQ